MKVKPKRRDANRRQTVKRSTEIVTVGSELRIIILVKLSVFHLHTYIDIMLFGWAAASMMVHDEDVVPYGRT